MQELKNRNLVISEIYTPCDGQETHSSYSINYVEEDAEQFSNRYEDIVSGLDKFALIGRLILHGANEVTVLLGHDEDVPVHKKVIKEVANHAGYKVVVEEYWKDLTEGHILVLKKN